MSKNGNDKLFSNSNEENYRKRFYEKLKKAEAKALKDKGKDYYIYKYAIRDIKQIIYEQCRLVAELDIRYKRSIFRKRNASDSKSYYFVDEELGIEKRQKVFVSDITAFVTHISYYTSYRKFIKGNNLRIAPSTITNILNRTNLFFRPQPLQGDFKKVFVSVDGMSINSSKTKSKRSYEDEKGRKRNIKSAKVNTTNAVIFTGYNLVHEPNKNDVNKRRRLENRTLLHYPSHLKSKDIAADIEHKIKQIYSDSVKKIILIGDGALDISNIGSYFIKKSKRYLDSFHFSKALKKFLRLSIRQKLNLGYYAQLSYDEFKSELIVKKNPNKFIDEDGVIDEDKIRKDSNLSYVLDWFENWKEGYNKGYISPIEGIQGNYLADTFKRKRRFGEHNRNLLIAFIFAEQSGWEISAKPKNGFHKHSDFKKFAIPQDWGALELRSYPKPHGIKTNPTTFSPDLE